jgi:hypothetical protein
MLEAAQMITDQSLSGHGHTLPELPASGGDDLSAKGVGNLVSVAGVNSIDASPLRKTSTDLRKSRPFARDGRQRTWRER